MALRRCFVVESFYLQVRNICPRISLRDLPCHRTMMISFRHQGSPTLLFLAIFLLPRQKSLILTYPCSLSQCHSLLYTLLECNPNKHDRGILLVLPNQRLS